MPEFQRILVSHDLQVGGETATESALTIADRSGAELKLVHVVEPYHLSQRLSHLFTLPYSQQDLVQKAEQKMAIKVANTAAAHVPVEYEVRTGKPFVELIRACREWRADLIVVGSPTDGASSFLGSTGERVVRKAPVPVFIATTSLSTNAKTFLVPTDFSPCGDNAAKVAVRLAQQFGGRLLFIHVLEWSRLSASQYLDGQTAPPSPLRFPPAQDKFEQAWNTLISSLSLPSGVPWATRTVEGRAATEITQQAQQTKADLIVMGTHGTGALDQMLIGSVAEAVVRTAPCPVLTIRPEAFRFEQP